MKNHNIDFHVSGILVNPQEQWGRIKKDAMGKSRVAFRKLDVDWKKYNTKDYLFTHDTACCSVETEENGYWITPPCWELVNANGNAWTTPVLLASFKTFIGGENYLEHCFVKGTRILMSDGTYRNIEDVKEGDKVINRLGQVDTVKNVQIRKSNDLYEIQSRSIMSRKMLVTGNHPFYVVNCKKNRNCVFTTTKSSEGQWIEARNLDGNKYSLTIPVCDFVIETPEINENRAELIGWFLAEGNFTYKNKFHDGVSGIDMAFSANEREKAEKLKNLLIVEFGNDFRKDCEPRIYTHYYHGKESSLTLTLCNVKVAEFFYKYCGEHSWSKKMNESLLYMNKNLQKILLTNIFLGDGTFKRKQRGISICLVSQDLIQQIKFISNRLGLNPTYKRHEVLKRYDTLTVVDGYEVYVNSNDGSKKRPSYELSYSMQDSRLFDEQRFENVSSRKSIVFENGEGRWILDKFVISKSDVEEQDVYNLEIENDNSYIAEGVAVHNCQIPALSKGKILDAIARPVVHHSDKYGNANIYVVDVLVATERKHESLIERIESGKLNTLSMGCHVDGTKVLMADGTTKNIEDIKVGDAVFTHKNNVAVVESTRRRLTEPNELHRLSISGMPDTYVTAEHPYWTLIGYDKCKGCGKPLHAHTRAGFAERDFVHWCSSSCKQKHDNSMKKEHDEFFEQKMTFDWKRVDELVPGNWVAIPLGRDNSVQRKSLGKARSRLLGYFLAEGNFQGKEVKTAVEYTFSSNEMSYIEEIKEYAIELGIPEDKIYVQVRESRTNARIVIHDKEFAKWLYENAGEHSWEKKINPELLEYDDETLKHIIGSYINGDGHITKRDSKVSACSVSKNLIEQIGTMMRLVSIPNVVYMSKKATEKERAIYTVLICQGHGGKLKGYCDKCADVPIRKLENEFHGYMLRKVKANETLSMTAYVNNIHVINETEDHSFIANGVAVHNCICNYTTCSICGKVIGDNDKNCEHIDKHLGQMVTCQDGKDRICSELCGAVDENGNYIEDSNKFIEISWVSHPAFQGAVVNAFVETNEIKATREKEKDELAKLFDGNLFERLKVADTDSKIALKITKEIGKVDRISGKIMDKM